MAISYSHNLVPNPNKNDYYEHLHNEYEILFFYEGDADYIIEGNIYRLQKNTLLVIRPAVYHYLQIRSSLPYRRVVFNFSDGDLTEENSSFLQSCQPVFQVSDSSPIVSLLDMINSAHAPLSDADTQYLRGCVINMIILSLRTTNDQSFPAPEIHSSLLSDMLSFIESNPSLAINTKILAERFFVSPSWIVHSFKKHLGISVQQFINRKKILYAQQLIAGGASALDAAVACGYDDYTTFFRQYKKIIGHAPKQSRGKN